MSLFDYNKLNKRIDDVMDTIKYIDEKHENA